MAYVITQRCCNDASCVTECPVDCIRPTPDQPEFATAEMLYIDPDTCIDCGACVDACPVDAIFSEDDLLASLARYREINAAYFQRHPLESNFDPLATPTRPPKDLGTLRVAIVGAGPAACYAADELLRRSDVEVEMFDRLPTPWGLVRAGVAPDHAGTKNVANMFDSAFRRDTLQYYLNVEVGQHIDHQELLDHHHAVIYAVGASSDRKLGVPGEDLPGSHSATEFVAWYNGHPDFADREFDLSGERAVIVGNGNVALDVARVLTVDPDELAKTDIADHALDALRRSNIREVVILGRRGPLQAAYSTPEFLALTHLKNVDVVVDAADLELDPHSRALLDDPNIEPSLRLKYTLAEEYSTAAHDPAHKRIVFRYLATPTAVHGDDHVTAVEFAHNELSEENGQLVATATDRTETLATGLVLRSIGYRGVPVPGLPFDERRGTVPSEHGRVIDATEPVPGVYVSGWIKRGPRGVIGSNRVDAEETVEALIADFIAGKLTAPTGDRAALQALLAQRQPDLVDRKGWKTIDQAEKTAGKAAGRPRVKFTTRADLLKAAKG
ncbi:putative ferredoxin/ferredoxin--NADP reductase [Nocardia neocaledoniensis NBRC 108232]|uniref:ferredoxin--NADP(+) reductase n=1 Tax=Nocardia neocaledoniensis TaxID=236511 RepID=A0A317NFV2_9NOCA|nr:FAD-dependent oxidoreductase [Nocardia neocaledoniensis]PWV73724.1 ferredoxin--NADP+ reductase [Nocardia neocaledoniensis]GEM29710.1 putative ferredoxin/ferredoxin--NADP reductase [Nocardia neocaledoniensis NBRC 108232]